MYYIYNDINFLFLPFSKGDTLVILVCAGFICGIRDMAQIEKYSNDSGMKQMTPPCTSMTESMIRESPFVFIVLYSNFCSVFSRLPKFHGWILSMLEVPSVQATTMSQEVQRKFSDARITKNIDIYDGHD